MSGQYKVDGDRIIVTQATEGYLMEKGHSRADKVYTFFFEQTEDGIRLVVKDDNGFTYKCYK